jgi:hypothetical protein
LLRLFVTALSIVSVTAAGLVAPGAASPRSSHAAGTDVRSVGPDLNGGRALPLDLPAAASERRAALRAPKVGDRRAWLSLDDVSGQLYLKRYKLRAEGRRAEIWVANDRDIVSSKLSFPAGDCRNDGRVTVTDKQVRYLLRVFEENVYPKESEAFSRPPPRDGSNAVLPSIVGQPRDYYEGPGRRIVILVDNVRDENFYDLDNSRNVSYIAGFFSSQYNLLLDRNVLTIDAFDWRHRLHGDPPHQPVPNDACASKPARPFLYEGVLAHEYQHLLEHYSDSAETTWVNEGLSDWAQTVTGYVDARTPITDVDFDSHVQAFLGWLGLQTPANPNPSAGGPENSLTLWRDQGDDEILADYGAAYTFMLYLADQFGDRTLRRLHRDPGVGLDGVQAVLDAVSPGTAAAGVLHRWAAMTALDAALDDGAALTGGTARDYSSARLHSSINWDVADAYAAPGAPPNGSDYVRLRDATGTYLSAGSIDEIEFDGDETLPPEPVEWTVDEDPPDEPDDPALYSGAVDDADRSIVRAVTVPTSDPTLSFDTSYDIDEGNDGGFVQVSTDDGATYRSLANEHTTDDFPPGGAEPGRQAPGLTGTSDGWMPMTFDLSELAGQDVLLSFRYITDRAVTGSGWWIDDVALGGEVISLGDDVDAWATPTQLRPEPVLGFTLQLVAFDDAHANAWVYEVPLDAEFDGGLPGDDLLDAIGSSAQTVAAIVTQDDPTERIEQYAPYTLTVNGIEQPGG